MLAASEKENSVPNYMKPIGNLSSRSVSQAHLASHAPHTAC
jgi:hypothetical protein